MSLYRKKPVTVEAIQWYPDRRLASYNQKYVNHIIGTDQYGVEYTVTEVGIQTLEGFMKIKPGDYLITGIKGERYPCREDIFNLTYEKV